MKRVVIGVVVGAMLGFGASAFAGKHPNLEAAHHALKEAEEKVTAAQKANEYDMEGHAAKAKELIAQALGELGQATKAANENKK